MTIDVMLTSGEELRLAVLRASGLRCSIGIARTKLLSVLATKRAKPNGLYVTLLALAGCQCVFVTLCAGTAAAAPKLSASCWILRVSTGAIRSEITTVK